MKTEHALCFPCRCLVRLQLTCCGVTAKDLRRPSSTGNLPPPTYHDSPLDTPTHIVTRNDPQLSPPVEPVWQRRVKDVRDRDRSYHVTGARELMDLSDVTSFRTGARDVIRNNGVRETVLTAEGAQTDDVTDLNEHDSFIPARHLPAHAQRKKPKRKSGFKKHESIAALQNASNVPTAIEEWRLIFLAFDKICFLITTILLSLGFWLMVTTKGQSDTEPRILAD